MTLAAFTQAFLPAIEDELKQVVNQNVPDLEGSSELRHMLAYHLGWEGPGAGPEAQGKRIRPILVLLSTSCSGRSWQRSLPAAAAVELIHNFSLIHDDIQDRGELRRNRPTLWVKWGIAQAINAGDTMFTLAQMAILRLAKNISPKTASNASQLLNKACIDLTRGQYLDLSYESKQDLSIDNYWPMIEGKTAALLSACTEMGALIAGATPEIRSAFRDFGRYLGLAFQVQDDFLGIWGESAQTGKSIESDLVSRKKTLPVLYGLERKGKFADLWNSGSILVRDVPAAVELLASEGAYDFTKETADRLTRLALQSLEKAVPATNEAGKALIELTDSLLQRNA